MITGTGHVALRVSDVERSLRFYRDQLGLEEAFRLERDGKLWLVYVKLPDGTFVELFPGYAGRFDLPEGSVGVAHFCLLLDDAAETARALRVRGVETDEVRKGRSGCLQFFVADPDGHRIELMQILPDSLQARHGAPVAHSRTP